MNHGWFAPLVLLVACGGGSAVLTTDGGGNGDGGDDAGAEAAPPHCTPGAEVFCRCSNRDEGMKACAADGQSFEACKKATGPCPP